MFQLCDQLVLLTSLGRHSDLSIDGVVKKLTISNFKPDCPNQLGVGEDIHVCNNLGRRFQFIIAVLHMLIGQMYNGQQIIEKARYLRRSMLCVRHIVLNDSYMVCLYETPSCPKSI
jgi:hypothetical protein